MNPFSVFAYEYVCAVVRWTKAMKLKCSITALMYELVDLPGREIKTMW